MQTSQTIIAREPTLGEELAACGDHDIVEMTNLQEKHTGIPGVLFISSALGPHGPRVKYFTKAGRDQRSFSVSIAESPAVVANSLPSRELNRAAPDVVRWVKLNREALLRFWNEGETFSVDELVAFVESLQKV